MHQGRKFWNQRKGKSTIKVGCHGVCAAPGQKGHDGTQSRNGADRHEGEESIGRVNKPSTIRMKLKRNQIEQDGEPVRDRQPTK